MKPIYDCLLSIPEEEWDGRIKEVIQTVKVDYHFETGKYEVHRDGSTGDITEVIPVDKLDVSLMGNYGENIVAESVFSTEVMLFTNIEQELFDANVGDTFDYELSNGVLNQLDSKYLWTNTTTHIRYELLGNEVIYYDSS